MSDPAEPRPPRMARITHGDAEENEQRREADLAIGERRFNQAMRERALQRLRADIPEKWTHQGHLSVDERGSIQQTFSAADGCGCGKPDFSSFPNGPLEFTMTPSAPSRGHSSFDRPGGGAIDAQAGALAARVDRVRAQFAAKPPVVVFDESGAILGTADPKNITKPDGKKLLAVFGQNRAFLGLTSVKNVTKVDQGEPAQQPAQQQPEQPQAQQPQQTAPQMAARLRR